MRIIDPDNRHDYYDSIQRNFTTSDLVYLRKHEVIYGGEADNLVKSLPDMINLYGMNFGQVIIGFCGKIYRCFTCDGIVFDIDELWNKYREHRIKHSYRSFLLDSSQKRIISNFDNFEKKKDSYRYIFEKHLCPIWTIDNFCKDYRFTKNPTLKEFDFYKIFDTYSAYQEISMFLGSLAFPEKPIPVISDKDLAFAKGFDKHSFRRCKK